MTSVSGSDENRDSAPKSGSSRFWVVISILLFFMFCFSLLINFILGGAVASMMATAPEQGPSPFQTKVVSGKGDADILVLNVQGVIQGGAGYRRGGLSPTALKKKLKQAKRDPRVKAILLRISSPGGEVSTTDTMYNYLKTFRKEAGKPIVAYIDGMAASGGYYLAVACDEIISHPVAITGSIGVIMRFYQMQELFENKLGVKEVVVKSGANKDIGSMSKDLTPEQRQVLQSIVDDMYNRFLEVVKDGRPKLAEIAPEELRKIADGKIYTSNQAMELGLLDSTGYFEEAVALTAKKAGLEGKDYRVIMLQHPRTFMEKLLEPSMEQQQISTSMLQQFQEKLQSPKFYYLFSN